MKTETQPAKRCDDDSDDGSETNGMTIKTRGAKRRDGTKKPKQQNGESETARQVIIFVFLFL